MSTYFRPRYFRKFLSSNSLKKVPMEFGLVTLGTDMVRNSDGSFSGEHDGWSPNKIFIDRGTDQAEAFLNINEQKKLGEFSEKDEEYRPLLTQIIAAHFRDFSAQSV